MEFISMIAMNLPVPTVAFDAPISAAAMAIVTVICGLGALAAFAAYQGRIETGTRRRTAHLKLAPRPAFGAAH
ncbi:MAG TPA: MHYT domain-containing protein [Candidatus Binatia bacterium]|nr:MHYT domain-containing protein [Candidatus Binatia bacterium]